jgi:hypothetical protein
MSASLRFGSLIPLLFATTMLPSAAVAGSPVGDAEIVKSTPGLVAFWCFGEAPGAPRISAGTANPHPLEEVGGPVARVAVGPFSGYSAHLTGTEFLRIPYADTKDLNISGPRAQVSMFAVVRIEDLAVSRTIAGMWSEGLGPDDDSGSRQYGLLMNMPLYGGPDKLVPHISNEGGVTRRADGTAFPWCADYAVSAQPMPTERWCTVGFTYDGKWLSAYIDGRLDRYELDPVAHGRTDPYFTAEGPGGGSRGLNPYYHGRGIFAYDPTKHTKTKPMGGSDFIVGARFAHGTLFAEGKSTIGLFGGLAVFDRALTEEEMRALHAAANIDALNNLSP